MFSIVNVTVEILNIIYCLKFLLNPKTKINQKAILLILVDVFIFLAIEKLKIDEKSQVIIYIMIVFYVYKNYKISIFKSIENFVFSIVIICIIQLSLAFPCYIFRISFDSEILLAIILQIVTLMIIFSFKNTWNIIGNFINNSRLLDKIIFGLFPIGIIIILIKYKMNIGLENYSFIMVIVGGIIIGTAMYNWQKEKIELDIKRTELHISRVYYESFKDLLMAIRKNQHDFNNHLQAIYALHYSIDNYQELVLEQKKYLNEISHNNKFYKLINIDNPVISGFIYQKIIEADSKDFAVSYEVKLQNKFHNIPDYVLVELIGILWDNAIESGEILEKRKIKLKILDLDSELEILIANPINDIPYSQILNFFSLCKTTKGENRGIGLGKIKEYEKKYDFNLMINKEQYGNEYWLCIKIVIQN